MRRARAIGDAIAGLDSDELDRCKSTVRRSIGFWAKLDGPPRANSGNSSISPVLTAAGVAGLVLVGILIVSSGADQVAHAMLTLGWRLAPITLFHLLPLGLAALSWRQLMAPAGRLSIASACWIRWIRESINNLLPVASIGGDVAGVRLTHLRGVGSAEAAASVVVDTTVGVVTQLAFVLAGVTLLMIRSTDVAALLAARVVLIGIAAFVVALTLFVWLQHRNMAVALTGVVRRLIPEDWRSVVADRASAIDDEVVATYRRRPALVRAGVLRLATWIIGAGEVWLITYFLGRSLSLIDALILESLGNGVYAAAFIVPGALGVLEGGYVMFGALFGLPADISLTISLSKRVRELLLGLPGLLAWQWAETRGLWRRTTSP